MSKNVISSCHSSIVIPFANPGTYKDDPSESTLAISTAFEERVTLFALLEQLNYLCRGVQRHRGYSMGLLAGNQSFLQEFDLLQEQLARRISLVATFTHRHKVCLSENDIERLHYAWNTIKNNWQDDSVLENYELHSHFVEQLLLLINKLAEEIKQPFMEVIFTIVGKTPDTILSDKKNNYQLLLLFSSRQLPHFIELMGKVRALSVHAAAIGNCDIEQKNKLNYLLKCVRQKRQVIVESADYLQQRITVDVPALLTIRTYGYKLDFLIDKINRDIIGSPKVTVKDENIFHLVTDLIDNYWDVCDNSLALLSVWQKQDMEQWLVEG